MFWADSEDSAYDESGWSHGASPYGTQPFYPSKFDIPDGNTALVRPAALFYNDNLKAFAFEMTGDGLSTY